MEPRTHGLDRELARHGNLLIAESGRFAKDEHIAIQFRQPSNGVVKRRRKFLRGGDDGMHERDGRRAPLAITQIVERQVPRDLEDPRAPANFAGFGDTRSGDTKEYLLREITGGLGGADHAAEVPEHA